MNEHNLQSVSITIGSTMYGRFEDLPNTVSHVLAEFIDNALQSYRDNKSKLKILEPEYKLKIFVDIEWNEDDDKRAKKIIISDNAAGIDKSKYANAFMPAKTPENNTGLNEFGMGLKTAVCWLGETWSVQTKALGEDEERTIEFNLKEVIAKDLKELPVKATPKNTNSHYTIITITNPTKNVPANRSLSKIKTELASIYRKSLRENEMQLSICDDVLSFNEYDILFAPPAKTPNETPIYWKKDIDFKFKQYKAKGFIGILKDINSSQNGFVLLRRGRVIIGAESDGRYFPKCLSGSSGTFRFKRIFGELELEGFEVSFNKNDIQDKENLEALMEALKGEIHTKDFDLYNQAEDYRLDDYKKQVKKIVSKHNKSTNPPIVIDTNKTKISANTPAAITSPIVSQTPQPSQAFAEFKDKYTINGIDYTLEVRFVEFGEDLFWVDVSKKSNNIIICMINTSHVFFNCFGKPSDSIVAIIKTIAISKFTAKEIGDDSATELFNYFNEYIKKTKI